MNKMSHKLWEVTRDLEKQRSKMVKLRVPYTKLKLNQVVINN